MFFLFIFFYFLQQGIIKYNYSPAVSILFLPLQPPHSNLPGVLETHSTVTEEERNRETLNTLKNEKRKLLYEEEYKKNIRKAFGGKRRGWNGEGDN